MKKRFLSLIIALAMMVGVFTPLITNAADDEHKTDVVIHKMELKSLTGWPKDAGAEGADKTKYDGSKLDPKYFGTEAKELDKVKFYVFKITEENYNTMKKSSSEYATKEDVTKKIKGATLVKNVVENDGKKDEKDYFETTTNGATVPGLVDGYYWIVEDTDSVSRDGRTFSGAAAVPFGLTLPYAKANGKPFGTGDDALHVYPKNTLADKPQIDKNFASNNGLGTVEDKNTNQNTGAKYENYDKEKATAKVELGKNVPYEVKTQIPAGAKYKKLVWTDQMTKGLTYNKDLKVMLGTTGLKEGTDYTVISTDRGFTLKFIKTGLTEVEKAAKTKATDITLTYSATVNANAIPGKVDANDVAFDYSNKPGQESEPKEGKPNNGEIKVEKSWAVDGKEVTDADKTVKALFTLQVKDGEKWKDVESYEATAAENFKHTFTGLDNNKTYRVVEQVSGYEPAYVSFENGVAVIKNTKDKTNPEPLNPTEPKVVTGGKRFVKADQDDGTRLAGAEFIVKKNVDGTDKFLKKIQDKDIQKAIADYKAADKEYKDAVKQLTQNDGVISYPDGVTAGTIKELKDKRDKAFEAANITYEWVESKNDAAKFISNEKGQVEIYGIEYGENYTLVETKAPAGYGTPTNADFTFTVDSKSYNSHANGVTYDDTKSVNTDGQKAEALRVNNKKVTIPQTGGIGTIIFTAIGLAIMASAIIAIKKRQATEAR